MIFIVAIGFLLTGWAYWNMVRTSGKWVALSNLLSGLLAGVVAGLVFGVTARVAMRLLAMGMSEPMRYSASGSATVITIFATMGLGLAIPYAALFRSGSRGHPFLYATLLSVITVQPFIRAAAQDMMASPWEMRVIVGVALVTLLLWFPYVWVLERTLSRIKPPLDKWLTVKTAGEIRC